MLNPLISRSITLNAEQQSGVIVEVHFIKICAYHDVLSRVSHYAVPVELVRIAGAVLVFNGDLPVAVIELNFIVQERPVESIPVRLDILIRQVVNLLFINRKQVVAHAVSCLAVLQIN